MASGVLRVPAISDSRRRQGTTGQDYRRRELLMSRRVSAPPRQSSSPRFWMLRLRRMSQRERAKRSTSTASSTAASQRTAGSGIPLRAEALRAAERARITDRKLNGGYANPRIGHFQPASPSFRTGDLLTFTFNAAYEVRPHTRLRGLRRDNRQPGDRVGVLFVRRDDAAQVPRRVLARL